MASINLTTRELHDLLTPVMPHAGHDKSLPQVSAIRLEVRDNTLYAIATDRVTMAVARHPLPETTPDTIIAIGHADAAALLKLFKHTRTDNPKLQLTIGNVEAETVLDPTDRPALTITAEDGKTLVLHGREDVLKTWRTIIGKFVHREAKAAPTSLALTAKYLPRWTKAIRNGTQLEIFLGSDIDSPIVLRADDNFIGVWAACDRGGKGGLLSDSVWGKELPPPVETAPASSAKPKARAVA